MDKLETVFQISEKAFLAEQERAKNLTDKSEKYISAIAVIIGFQLLDMNSLILDAGKNCYNWLGILGLILLGIAFVMAFTSNRIYVYHSYPTSDQYLSILENTQMDDTLTKVSFTKMYWKLLDINTPLNNTRAKLLSSSANLITAGFMLIVIRYILDYFIK